MRPEAISGTEAFLSGQKQFLRGLFIKPEAISETQAYPSGQKQFLRLRFYPSG